MTATNVTIDNWIDYSSQLNNLTTIASDLSSIATYLSNLATLTTSIQNIETKLDNVISSINSLSNSTQLLINPISRISTATEILSTTTMKLATTASLSYSYHQDKDANNNYFSFNNYSVIPETESAGAWIGKTTTINLVTSTNNSSILVGQRVEGNNIDLGTFVTGVNTSTKILTLSQQTLGSSKGKAKLFFFAT
jgi:hypothetical protein